MTKSLLRLRLLAAEKGTPFIERVNKLHSIAILHNFMYDGGSMIMEWETIEGGLLRLSTDDCLVLDLDPNEEVLWKVTPLNLGWTLSHKGVSTWLTV